MAGHRCDSRYRCNNSLNELNIPLTEKRYIIVALGTSQIDVKFNKTEEINIKMSV